MSEEGLDDGIFWFVLGLILQYGALAALIEHLFFVSFFCTLISQLLLIFLYIGARNA